MKHVAMVAVLGVLAGCGRKKPEEGIEPPPAMPQPGSAGSAGSAEAPKPITGEALAKRYDECLGFYNAAKYDDFKGCFADGATSEAVGLAMPPATGPAAIVEVKKLLRVGLPDLKAEPLLALVNGHHVAGIVFVHGTQSAALKSPLGELAASNKPMGILFGQVMEADDAGRATKEGDYFDLATLVGQLSGKPVRPALAKAPFDKQVVIAKDDATEKANVELVKRSVDAFNKHDAKAFGDTLADDVVWSDQAAPADANKKQVLDQTQAAWKASSDLKLVSTSMWAAGDYVVDVGTNDGTNDGPIDKKPATKKKFSVPFLSIHKIAGDKIKAVWVFTQSVALAQQLGLAPTPPAPAKP